MILFLTGQNDLFMSGEQSKQKMEREKHIKAKVINTGAIIQFEEFAYNRGVLMQTGLIFIISNS